MREYQLAHGVDEAGAYETTMRIMAVLLVIGFIANLLVKPVAEKYWLPDSVPRNPAASLH
jgi:formate hydrogenlyase subunit 3/multisubunit Na+/H+ antiporter MnhD subunit